LLLTVFFSLSLIEIPDPSLVHASSSSAGHQGPDNPWTSFGAYSNPYLGSAAAGATASAAGAGAMVGAAASPFVANPAATYDFSTASALANPLLDTSHHLPAGNDQAK
jgi:hypothetical protein